LHRNSDQRTYLGHLRPLSSARRAVCSARKRSRWPKNTRLISRDRVTNGLQMS
jgi:hypothetical protein